MNNTQQFSQEPKIKAMDNFELWINQRPKWLQSAARLLIDQKKMPTEVQIVKFVELCIKEALGENDGFNKIIPGAFERATQSSKLCIKKISDVTGVNAIKSGASISFGDANIAVIYGANGTGKTGFSRILKQVCGSRAKDDILGDVFYSGESPIPNASIEVSKGGSKNLIQWSLASGVLKPFRHMHVFDSKTAQMYMGVNEVSYEPSRMRFISSLIKISDHVSSHLNIQKSGLISKLPTCPVNLINTKQIQWLKALKDDVKIDEIDKMCEFSTENNEERIAIETSLAQKDIQGRLKDIVREQKVYMRVKSTVDSLKKGLSNDKIKELVQAKNDAKLKRKIATEEAKKVFSNNEFEGVGQSTWMAMWKYAKEYSEKYAYPGLDFPVTNDGSSCVLCQQKLAADGSERIKKFHNYVQGALEEDAKVAESIQIELEKKLPILPSEHDWIIYMNHLKINESVAKEKLEELNKTLLMANDSKDIKRIPQFDWSFIDRALNASCSALDVEEKSLKDLQKDGRRKQLEEKLKELQAVHWLSLNKNSILDERKRLVELSTLDSAIKLTNTATLTKKKNELAKLELDDGYQTRFANELKRLGGTRLQVKPASQTLGKGKIAFGLELQGSKEEISVKNILSEGETRIVALAAFLADITGAGQRSPFIFDDPISSLDQDYEEKVVARLVDLSMERQVIIFTHRLSLLSLVEATIKRLKERLKDQGSASVSVHIETLRKLGNKSGVVAKLSLRDSKPMKAINRIKDEFLPQLRKHIGSDNADSYERDSWQVCSEFRILLEKCVESILLNDVIGRFRRDLQTKNRLVSLSKINQSDCLLIDEMMSRYSIFEHSQPNELPATTPDIDQIEEDVDKLSSWISEFNNRGLTN